MNDRSVRILVGPQRQYDLTLGQRVHDLIGSQSIFIRSDTSFICVGERYGVRVLAGEPLLSYSVTAIERAPTAAGAAPEGD